MCNETKSESALSQTATQEAAVVHRLEPAVDIYEQRDSFQIVADVPGVEQGDITLKVDGDSLQLEASARAEVRSTAIKRPYQQLQYLRSFKLGRSVDREHIEAELRQGVLHIRLPKVQGAQPRQIEVRVSTEPSGNN